MILKVKLVELMLQIDQQMYLKHITTSYKGDTMLYVLLSKELCVLLQFVLLFYRKLRTEMEDFWFCGKSIRLLCFKKNNKWITNDCDLAC